MKYTALFPLVLLFGWSATAQQPSDSSSGRPVPQNIRFSGVVSPQHSQPAALRFSLYDAQVGGAPLWQETQNVQPDAEGRFTVLLGSAQPFPAEIFAANSARWLGIQVLADAEPEQPRVMLVSVPYALKAQDAETLGGLPPSAFLRANAGNGGSTSASGSKKGSGQAAALELEGTVSADPHTTNAIPKFTSTTDTLADSMMFELYDQVAIDAVGHGLANEDVVKLGDGTGRKKRFEVDGRLVGQGFDMVTSLPNAVHAVSTYVHGVGMQANADGIGFSSGITGTSRGLNGAGVIGFALPPLSLQPQAPGDFALGVLATSYHPQGAALEAFNAYDGTALGADFPVVSGNIGVYSGTAHSSAIPLVLEQIASSGPILSARAQGTEVASMNSAGDLTTSGSISATGNITTAGTVTAASFAGSGAGLTGITAFSITDGTITSGKLDFDPATQAELDAHKSSGDHDARYIGPSGGSLTGTLLLAPKGTATSGAGFDSQALDLSASVYNSGNGVPYKQTFRFDVEALNNNTPLGTFTGRLRLGFANEFFGAPPSPTGISFDPDGTVTAVKFAGDGSSLTNVVASSATDLDCSGCVGTTDLADLAVTTAKIADLNVSTGKIANAAVTGAKLGLGAVGNTNLADNSVTSPKIQDLTITDADVSNSAALSPGKISGTAATLSGANVFSADQTISGNLTLSGAINTGFRVQSDTFSGDGSSPNVLGGSSLNTLGAGVYGAFIGGGGSTGNPNQVNSHYGVVTGGRDNTAGNYGAVGGGFSNEAGTSAVVAGGELNLASGSAAVVGGGSANVASGSHSTVPGGVQNTASGHFSFAAGWQATVSHDQSFVWSDGTAFSSTMSQQFRVHATNSIQLLTGLTGNAGGLSLQPTADTPNVILGNITTNPNAASVGVRGAAIGGGGHSNVNLGGPNLVTGDFGTVSGGVGNQAGQYGSISGGYGNQVTADYGGVGGGLTNTASGSRAFVGAGETNTAGGLRAVVGGGFGNSAGGEDANVSGGKGNSAPTIYSVVGGGIFNMASGSYATVSGGGGNQATAQASAVGGGESNLASGTNATVPGGKLNEATGTSTFAAGQRAKATHPGSFVWGDTTNSDINSSANDQFSIRAAGGFRYLDSGNTARFTISAAGTVTAAAFVGDGSGLTGISAGTATDLDCTGCVGASEVGFNYAGSASAGGAATNAELLDGLDSTAFVQLSGSNSFSALNTFTAVPSGAAAGQGSLYVNPASASVDRTLLGLSVAGSEKLRVDAEGDLTARSAAFSGAVAVAVDATASSSGVSTGVKGTSASTSGTGVRGDATATTGSTFGVHGVNSSDNGIGVFGVSNHAGSATAYGVKGSLLGTAGAAVFASASNPSGTSYGLLAESVSSSSIPGRFDLKASTGTILLARSGSPSLSDRFSVAADGSVTSSGSVTAASFSGSGSGLTGVSAGDVACVSCVAVSELGFDPATQAELDTHKSSTDHDTRYALKAGDTITGALTVNGIVESTSGGFKFPDGSTQTTALSVATVVNPNRVALLRWYEANTASINVAAGTTPIGIAFDGENMWVANLGSNNVTKIRASDGSVQGTFAIAGGPYGVAYDGATVWVTNRSSNNVTKVRPSDGANLGTIAVGTGPQGIAFDGANLWIANRDSNNVTKIRASDGANLGTFTVGTAPQAVAFDGTFIWVVNEFDGTVSKLNSAGTVVDTIAIGALAFGVAFDGANVWVTSTGAANVKKLRASDGALQGTFALGASPNGLAFDGSSIWIALQNSTVKKLRASDGAVIGTYAIGGVGRDVAFDGANVWITNQSAASVSKR